MSSKFQSSHSKWKVSLLNVTIQCIMLHISQRLPTCRRLAYSKSLTSRSIAYFQLHPRCHLPTSCRLAHSLIQRQVAKSSQKVLASCCNARLVLYPAILNWTYTKWRLCRADIQTYTHPNRTDHFAQWVMNVLMLQQLNSETETVSTWSCYRRRGWWSCVGGDEVMWIQCW